MPPRITFLARSLEIGGAETQLVALATRLQSGGRFAVSVVTFYPGGALEPLLRDAGVPLTTVDKRGRWDLARFGLRLVQCLRRQQPQVLHSYLGPPNLMAAACKPWLGGVRLVWGIRASDMDLSRYDWSWRAVFAAERLLSRIPDRVVANSAAGRDLVSAAGFPPGRIDVIPNGIDCERFRPDRASGAALRGKWLGDAGGPLIGIVARLDPMKDHETFLRAARVLSDAQPGARFVCVGGGPQPLASRLRAMAESLGLGDRVVWLGQRTDTPAVFNALDLATLSSAYGEGFPNAVGEAMASGVPCVVTDVGDAAEIVGNTGSVVPRRDAGALAAAWRSLSAFPAKERDRRTLAARRRIVENYSVDAMVAASATLYSNLLGNA